MTPDAGTPRGEARTPARTPDQDVRQGAAEAQRVPGAPDFGVRRTLARTAGGKAVDVYRPGPGAPDRGPTALLWHGIAPDERDILGPLAATVARAGLRVCVPDWGSDAPDGGRSQLLDSLAFARDFAAGHGGDTERFVLAGWSAGAPAAMGVVLRPGTADGPRLAGVVGIGSRYDRPARTTGTVPLEDIAAMETSPVPVSPMQASPVPVSSVPESPVAVSPVPVWLVHGTHDTVMGSEHTDAFAAALEARGWPVHREDTATDHAGVIMTEHDPARDRCVPARAGHAIRGGLLTASVLLRAAGLLGQREAQAFGPGPGAV
ncbi:alpha/beta hydrolase [Streptomyces sp. NPDC002055]|uniref:alpha/beta hydrolase n=1 Tax=Streptomyces sp. NPDC002055 TaxID=3154534 RepID=UPI0033320AE2